MCLSRYLWHILAYKHRVAQTYWAMREYCEVEDSVGTSCCIALLEKIPDWSDGMVLAVTSRQSVHQLE